MTDPHPANGTRYQLADHERRISKIEDANILVLADRVARLTSLTAWLIATIATFVLTILGGVIVFLVTQGTP